MSIAGLIGIRQHGGGGGGHVWLVAPGHALMITPVVRDDITGNVLLTRPLGGSWTAAEPVPVLTVAAVCACLSAAGHQPT